MRVSKAINDLCHWIMFFILYTEAPRKKIYKTMTGTMSLGILAICNMLKHCGTSHYALSEMSRISVISSNIISRLSMLSITSS